MQNYMNSNDSIISNVLNWFELKKNKCEQCQKKTYNFNTFTTFELDILATSQNNKELNITLFDCLNYHLKQQTKNLYCKNCGKYNKIKSNSTIFSTPNIFILSLDRGQLDQNLLDIKVDFQEKLNLSTYVEQDCPKKYELFGIVSIKNNISNNGYDYCCFNKSFFDNKWYFYTDEKCIPMDENVILNSHKGNKSIYKPCLLAYKAVKE